MSKSVNYLIAFLLGNFITIAASAQNATIIGNIKNGTSKDNVAAVSVTIKGTGTGTFSDDKGNFKISAAQLPVTLLFTSIGYELQEITVADASSVQVELKPTSALGQEVVVAASRVPERILESPVTIERFGTANIRNTPAPNYYDIVKTLKGVDIVNSSLTFTSVTTRGFSGSGNTRLNQFVDGMDNQAPGLNFSVGSIVGPNELDVENVELLPGASSALYGSGGMNGTLLINSKNPFKYQGLSFQVKQGIMHTGERSSVSNSPYYDWSLRWAKKLSDKFAFKIGGQLIQAKDWIATDESNYTGAGTLGKPIAGDRNNPDYDGVNIYGDEANIPYTMAQFASLYQGSVRQGILDNTGNTVDIVALLDASLPANATPAQIGGFISALPATLQPTVTTLVPFYFGLRNNIIPNQRVSRTGYKESDIINNNTVAMKLNAGLYYKLTSKTELSAIANFGTGNSVYTGSDRYALENLKIAQYKVELKNDNWFLRAYTTQENAGDAFNATVATGLFNEAWKPSASAWLPEYVGTYVQAISQGADQATAFAAARAYADRGRPVAGSDQFKALFKQVVSIPIPRGGQFLDRTDLYHAEGQYNLTPVLKFAEVLIGANWRQYQLNSQGTLFADTNGVIKTNEYGGYLQVSKKIIHDKLKLTASGRYDKNDNFDGKFTPRFSAVATIAPNQNIRASYQNAYRFPSNQNQYINLVTGSGVLIGGLPSLRDFYDFGNKPLYTVASVQAFQAGGGTDPSLLVKMNFDTYKPESVNSYEVGYKGLFKQKVMIDVYGYYSEYKDFIGRVLGVQVATQTGFSVSVNSPNKVNTYGYGIGINYLLKRNLALDINISGDNIDNPDPLFVAYYNTPKYRANIGLSNAGFGYKKRLGYNVQYRWQDKYFTESDFKQGDVAAFSTIDAQVSYKFPSIRSLVKLGATNLLNHKYKTAYGNPEIGGLYYISFGYNVF